MTDGIFAAAAGMQAQQNRIDLLSNDIANLDTTGYQSQRVSFSDLVFSSEQGVPVGAGAATTSLGPTQDLGTIQQNGNPLSLALDGTGYFQVKQADGTTALTRDGSFGLDADGNIVTSSGDQLDPPVRVPKGTEPSQITISPDGTVTASGSKIGKIAVVDVPAPSGLAPAGDNLYVATAASGSPVATSTKIEQGALETSNVDLSETLSDIIDAQRSYELASQAIKTQDTLLDDANQIPK